jgi:prolyl oligopeptidase
VDTGLHALDWPRQRAIDHLLEHTALTPLNVANEVDRYLAWPGQALAYKVGELAIRRLRARAEAALGAAFDLRAFHDRLLGAGALPLDLLEQRMEDWLAGASHSS